jgi:pimeloyl-ACP methyl ester carboxylesterase
MIRRQIVTIEDCDLSWMEIDAGGLHATGAPPSGARPLVLLHGLSDSSHTWDRVAGVLARRRRVLMPDLPGHGRSSRPDASYSIRYYAGIVARWACAAGLRDFDLVGHSLGGGVAQRMLIELHRMRASSPEPETIPRVRRLGLVASGGLGREVAWLLRVAAATGALERVGQPFMGRGTRVGMRILGGDFKESDRDRLARLNERVGSARAVSRTLGASVGLDGQRLHFLDHAHEIPALPPMAIFWGDRDRVIPVSHVDHATSFLEGVTVRRFARAGHYPHRESVHEFLPALLRFLDTEQASARLRSREKAEGFRVVLRRLLSASSAGELPRLEAAHG